MQKNKEGETGLSIAVKEGKNGILENLINIHGISNLNDGHNNILDYAIAFNNKLLSQSITKRFPEIISGDNKNKNIGLEGNKVFSGQVEKILNEEKSSGLRSFL